MNCFAIHLNNSSTFYSESGGRTVNQIRSICCVSFVVQRQLPVRGSGAVAQRFSRKPRVQVQPKRSIRIDVSTQERCQSVVPKIRLRLSGYDVQIVGGGSAMS